MAMSVQVFESAEELALVTADHVATRLEAGIAARGRASLALSGGRSPVGLYQALASGARALGVDWARVHIYFADERAVSPTDPESNFRLARETLIDPAGIPPPNVHRIRAEHADLEAVAIEYEARFPHALDVLVLGLGPDGHTCSLFPGSPLVMEHERRVVPVLDSPKPPARRITVTPRVLGEAREVAMVVIEPTRAEAVARALEAEVTPLEVPAMLVRDRDWYLVRGAAAWLRRPTTTHD
jgi:6-phosphogluconolactonase